jgi:endonuclease YncB( thermonuclease family)
MWRFAAIAGMLALPFAAPAASLVVVEGDKVLLDGRPAQLVDVDSPELCQPGGPQARRVFATLLGGEVTYEKVGSDAEGVDLVRLYADGREINQSLVQLGWAWDTSQSSPSRYAFAETVAQEDRIGLWAMDSPVPPWTWKQSPDRRYANDCDRYSLSAPYKPNSADQSSIVILELRS